MTLDIDSLFPEGISDEAAFVLCEVFSALVLALESRYLTQLRHHADAQCCPGDPEQPWKAPIK